MDRPNWDEFFIAIAASYSSRGTCDRLLASCVLVQNKRIVGAGYNGSIAGLETCDEAGHLLVNNHCIRTLHDVQNALANTIADLHGATSYHIGTPCPICVKELLQHGITRIVYAGEYDNGLGANHIEEFCAKKGVKLEQFCRDPQDVIRIFRKIFTRLRGKGGVLKGTEIGGVVL